MPRSTNISWFYVCVCVCYKDVQMKRHWIQFSMLFPTNNISTSTPIHTTLHPENMDSFFRSRILEKMENKTTHSCNGLVDKSKHSVVQIYTVGEYIFWEIWTRCYRWQFLVVFLSLWYEASFSVIFTLSSVHSHAPLQSNGPFCWLNIL